LNRVKFQLYNYNLYENNRKILKDLNTSSNHTENQLKAQKIQKIQIIRFLKKESGQGSRKCLCQLKEIKE
jgi:hypothetical protein